VNRTLRLWLGLAGLLLLVACTASARASIGDFFGGLFGAAAPVADAAGQPWLGALFGWAGHLLLAHPYESAGAGLVAATLGNHAVNGTPGTTRRRDVRATRQAKREAAQRVTAQMRVLDASTAHRKTVEAAEAKVRRATAKKNAALLAAQTMPPPPPPISPTP
jgi:hypothetical protein